MDAELRWAALKRNLLAACCGLLASAALAGCSAPAADASPDGAADGPLAASGFLEAEEVSVVAEVGGLVEEVKVEEGQIVEAGEIVVVLDDALLQGQRLQADASLDLARAHYLRLRAGASRDELAAAQAALDEAQTAVDSAKYAAGSAWAAANNPQSVDVQIAAVEAELEMAQRQVELLGVQLQEAQLKLDYLRSRPEGQRDSQAIELQEYAVQILQAQLRAAEAQRAGSENKLTMLQEQRDRPISAIARAHAAQGQVLIAEARLELAQATYDLVANGPLPEEIAIAEAQVEMARAQVMLIDAQIAQLTLTAPIGGVIATRSIHAGEMASPGVPLLTISNPSSLELIVYIPETQIGHVALGAPAEVAVDAYPFRLFEGVVTYISSEAEFTPRNVQTEEDRVNMVFAVHIRIANENRELKPGMPADATIKVSG